MNQRSYLSILPGFLLLTAALTLSARVPGPDAASPAPTDPLVYRHHSVGSAAFLQSTQGTVFQTVWKLPQTEAVRDQVLRSIAVQLAVRTTGPLTSASSNWVGTAAAMLKDVLSQESWVDVRGATGSVGWILAVQLPPERRDAWDKGLREWLSTAGQPAPKAVSWDGTDGFSAAVKGGVLSWASAEGWTVVGLAPALPGLWSSTLAEIRKSHRPAEALSDDWLKVEADLGRVRDTLQLIPEFMASQMELTFRGKGDNVRTEAVFKFAHDLNWTPEPWDLPTNFVREPLMGFAAARGIRPLVSLNSEVAALQLPSLPNQACVWSLDAVPFYLFSAFPQAGASNLLWQVLPKLPDTINSHGQLSGGLMWVSNTSPQIIWRGMPFMSPTLRPLVEGDREYLAATMVPIPPSKKRPPAELFGFLSRTNLAYYDWEITEQRIMAWKQIYQAVLLGFLRESPRTNAPTQVLMETLSKGNRLGNSVTEVTVTGPSEVRVMRQSSAGLTGFEWVSALRWFDSSNFPYTFESTPKMDLKKLAAEARARRGTNNEAHPAPVRPGSGRPGGVGAPRPPGFAPRPGTVSTNRPKAAAVTPAPAVPVPGQSPAPSAPLKTSPDATPAPKPNP